MYYITTPIPYTNSHPHLGHLLEAVFNDTIARFQRRLNDGNVILTMGVDQHGLKIYEEALKNKQEPSIFVKEQAKKFIDLWSEFDIKYDSWIETTSPEHKIVAQIVWEKLANKNYIYKKTYKGLYCKGCEDFYAPSQLNESGECPIHLTKPAEMNEENYFFKLSAFEDVLLDFLNSANIKPQQVANEQINFIKGGLQDISISRESKRLPWGIPVPGDDTQVMYVWFEALINYLTGAVDLNDIDELITGEVNPSAQKEKIWESIEKAMPIDFLYASKEIGKFHLVIWPAMLHGVDLPLPKNSLAHGMINDAEGKKFSKSLGNGVEPKELVSKFGIDGSRFLMLHDINISGDTNFSWDRMKDSYNAHLANNLGNLVSRVTNLVEKNLNGLVDLDKSEKIFDFSTVYTHLHNFDTKEALEEIIKAGNKGNELLEQTQPWKLFKGDDTQRQEATQILTNLVLLVKNIGETVSIFMPASGEKIYNIATQEVISKAEVLFPKSE